MYRIKYYFVKYILIHPVNIKKYDSVSMQRKAKGIKIKRRKKDRKVINSSVMIGSLF